MKKKSLYGLFVNIIDIIWITVLIWINGEKLTFHKPDSQFLIYTTIFGTVYSPTHTGFFIYYCFILICIYNSLYMNV